MNESLDMSVYQNSDLYYKRMALKYVYHASTNWDIHPSFSMDNYEPVGELVYRGDRENAADIVYTPYKDYVVILRLSKKQVSISLAGKTKEVLKDIVDHLKEAIPVADEPTKDAVKVKFWYMTNQGPAFLSRTIVVPDWPEIEDNYEASTKKAINHLFSGFTPSLGGQLILWQGNPGTGKTYALRSLCDSWREWCSIEYIVDPDAFFGGSSSYLVKLLSDSNDSYDDDGGDEDSPVTLTTETKKEWKLFILEDTGELLSQDAKEKTGQGLARLLNVVDGFIGQGLKILVLITSNEELGKLHPAVSRPGRCAAIVEFKDLDYPHARDWAKRKGIKLPAVKPYSLAELYSLASGFTNKAGEKLPSVLGFKAPDSSV